MRARRLTLLLSTVLIGSLVGCGSDGALDAPGPQTDSDAAQETDDGDAPSMEVTIDGEALDGDLEVFCGEASMGGAPESVYIANAGGGEVTLGGEPIDGLLSISVGYSDASGGVVEDAVVGVGDRYDLIASSSATLPGSESESLDGEYDGETWSFDLTLAEVGASETTHRVVGSGSC